jgi:putative DNA primase/helicase
MRYPEWAYPLLIKLDEKNPIEAGWNQGALSRWHGGDSAVNESRWAEIRAHCEQGRNIGLCLPPGLVALDADTSEATAWLDKALPDVPMQVTSRGAHFLCRVPDELEIPNGVSVEMFDGVSVDVRSAGRGQIVVEPSRHPSGFDYCWRRELPERLEDIPECPPLILEALTRAKPTNGSGGQPFSVPERITTGQRQDALYRLGRSLKAKGLGEVEILAALTTVNDARCDPPLDGAEVVATARHAATQEDSPSFAATSLAPVASRPAPCGSEHHTDVGNARRLVRLHGGSLHFCHHFAKWFAWDGARWRPDDSAQAMRFAKDTVAKMYTEAAEHTSEDERKSLAKWATTSEAHHKLCAMLAQAQSEDGISVAPDALDTEPMLLNVRNGTLDLERGVLRQHDPHDLITKLAPVVYDANATAPGWHRFLDRVVPDPDVRSFLQRAIGYSLTALTIEQVMFIMFGTGANGKTTLAETLAALLGDYWLRTPADTLLAKRDTGIPNDVARLRGARLVTAMELDEGRRLAEVKIKELTGGDTISARFMRGEWFDFKPVCKLWLGTNHKPQIRGTDHAIWRRIRLVPFEVQIPEPERDPMLGEKLAAELPGILAWAVEGCIAWQREGLQSPPAVLAATEDYREAEDMLGQFLTDRCHKGDSAVVAVDDLYSAFVDWMEPERAWSKKAFGSRIAERGFNQGRPYINGDQKRAWMGLALLENRVRS